MSSHSLSPWLESLTGIQLPGWQKEHIKRFSHYCKIYLHTIIAHEGRNSEWSSGSKACHGILSHAILSHGILSHVMRQNQTMLHAKEEVKPQEAHVQNQIQAIAFMSPSHWCSQHFSNRITLETIPEQESVCPPRCLLQVCSLHSSENNPHCLHSLLHAFVVLD